MRTCERSWRSRNRNPDSISQRVTDIDCGRRGTTSACCAKRKRRRTSIRYILANPVRSGLVAEPVEYPFWGSGVHTRDELTELSRAKGTAKAAPYVQGTAEAAPCTRGFRAIGGHRF